MLTEDSFDSDGVKLHYIDWGGAGRAVVLLAGLGGTAHLYRGLAPRLAEQYRVAGLTRRAHGRSDRPETGYDIETAIEDIRRFMDHLGIERATLIGHSWAGIEIPLFARTHPNRVDAVVYLDAVNVLLEPELNDADDPALSALDLQPQPGDMVSSEAYLTFIKRSRPDLASIWCDAIEADRLAYVALLVKHGPATEIVGMMREGLGPHRDPAYGDVNAPALAIVPGGKTHPFLRPDAPDELRRNANAYYESNRLARIKRRTELFRQAAPDARVVELDTSNHTIFIARESETVDAILTFLDDVGL